MAKEAKTSKKSRSPSASMASETTGTASNQKMVLRVRTTEATKRLWILNSHSHEETGAKSAKKYKTSQMKKKKKKKKKQNKNFDANKPKKPPTAFFYFLEDFRKEFQEQNPNVKSMREVGKACGEKWKTMTYEEKVKYYDIATEKRAEFDAAMAEYIKRKESDEDEETEDDSDFG